MRKNILVTVIMLLFFANPTYAENDSQKYVQISNSPQTEHDKIVIYEFFWY